MAEHPMRPANPFDLADDEPPEPPSRPPRVAPGQVIAEFRGFVVGQRMLQRGDVTLELRVPYEEKYKAIPVTDYAGVMIEVTVRRKPSRHVDTSKGDGDG